MDGGAPEPIGTRDAVIEVAYSVGALVRAVQMLVASLESLPARVAAPMMAGCWIGGSQLWKPTCAR